MNGEYNIPDQKRTVTCSECGQQQTVADAAHALGCTGCYTDMCVYCGCTEKRACVRENGEDTLVCGWALPAVCTFCVQDLFVGKPEGAPVRVF